jgi:hypothetical protein
MSRFEPLREGKEAAVNPRKILGPVLILPLLFAACSADYGRLVTLSKEGSEAVRQKLLDHRQDFDVRYQPSAVVFEPTGDDLTLLTGSGWQTVTGPDAWQWQLVRSPSLEDNPRVVWANYPLTGLREIRSPADQVYGYIIHQIRDLVSVRVVDVRTMRLYYQRARFGAGP